MRATLSEAVVEQIVTMVEANTPVHRITAKTGAGRSQIRYYRYKFGLPIGPATRRSDSFTAEQDAYIQKRIMEGAKYVTIAQELGRARSTVHVRALILASREEAAL